MKHEIVAQSVKEAFSQRLNKNHLTGAAHDILEMSISKIRNRVDDRALDYDHVKFLVKELDKHGYFELRGAAAEISSSLAISKMTVYKYLNN